MAKCRVKKSKERFIIELNRDEFDVVSGMLSDFADNPSRKVRMAYESENTYSKPSKRGQKIIHKIYKSLEKYSSVENHDYDYYDFWEDVDRPKEV